MKIESQHLITIALIAGSVALFIAGKEPPAIGLMVLAIIHFVISHTE